MENGEHQTEDSPVKNFFTTSRIITIVKECAILAIAAYLIHFIAEVIYYRNAEHRFLTLSSAVAYAAGGIALALLVYTMAVIADQYRKDKKE